MADQKILKRKRPGTKPDKDVPITNDIKPKQHIRFDSDEEQDNEHEDLERLNGPGLDEESNDGENDDEDEDDDEDEAPESLNVTAAKEQSFRNQESSRQAEILQNREGKRKRRELDVKLKTQKAQSNKSRTTTKIDNDMSSSSNSRLLPLDILEKAVQRDKYLDAVELRRDMEDGNNRTATNPSAHQKIDTSSTKIRQKEVFSHLGGALQVEVVDENEEKAKRTLAPSMSKNARNCKQLWQTKGRNTQALKPMRKGFLRT